MSKSCKFPNLPMQWVCPNCGAKPPGRVHYPVVCACGLIDKGNGKPFGRTRSIIPAYRTRGDGTGSMGPFDEARRIQLVHEVLAQRAVKGRDAWRELHCHEGNDIAWLEGIWEPQIPRFGCNCEESYRQIKLETPFDFTSPETFFASGVNIHNRVNVKLGRETWTHRQALEQWRPHLAWQHQQPRIRGCVAVTSISPRPKHHEVQRDCISSWMRLGLDVITGNMASELAMVRDIYPEVRSIEVAASESYATPTPRIRDLVGLHGGNAILLINSDIAIHGHQARIVDAIANRRPTAFIRHNWETHPGRNAMEKWGIDAFLLFPDQIETLPELDFAVGQPMWDYWVPFHLESIGCPIDWVGDPYCFHRSHPVHWSVDSIRIGQSMMRDHYSASDDWQKWRIERPFGGDMAK